MPVSLRIAWGVASRSCWGKAVGLAAVGEAAAETGIGEAAAGTATPASKQAARAVGMGELRFIAHHPLGARGHEFERRESTAVLVPQQLGGAGACVVPGTLDGERYSPTVGLHPVTRADRTRACRW